MKIKHRLSHEINLVTCHAKGVTAKEIYDYSIVMMNETPEVASVPNIWDFTDTEIWGDLSVLDQLFEDISPRIEQPAKVGFVTNNVLTGAICKRYSDLYRHHKYLEFATFISLRKCKQWVLSD